MNVPPILSDNKPPEPSAVLEGPRRSSRRRWWIHLLLLATYPLLIGLAGLGAGKAHGPALSGDAKNLVMVCVVQLAIFGLVFGLAWLTSRASRDDLLLRWRNGFWPVPLGIAYSVAIRLAVGLIVAVVAAVLIVTGVMSTQGIQDFSLANRPQVEAIVDVSAMRENPLYFFLTLTLVSFVLAGLREELWRAGVLAGLRVLWPGKFGSRAGQILAAGIAALIFGFGHLPQGVLATCMTGILGFGLGVIMILHRSIWPAAIAHGAFDATSLALLPWAMDLLQKLKPALNQ